MQGVFSCLNQLYEWVEKDGESNIFVNEAGEQEIKIPDNLITWVFEEGTFIPQAKLEGDKSYSIITNHLGTPETAYDEKGKCVWVRQLDIYESCDDAEKCHVLVLMIVY